MSVMTSMRSILSNRSNVTSKILFFYRTVIAPWPLFPVILCILGCVGALMPYLQVKAISVLIDSITSNPVFNGDYLEFLQHHGESLALFLVAIVINYLVTAQTFQPFIASVLNEKVQERLERLFHLKAVSTRLDMFESKHFHDVMHRARKTSGSGNLGKRISDLQRLIVVGLASIVILIHLGFVYWFLPIILFFGMTINITWNSKLQQKIINLNYKQTELNRKLTYWRNLISKRDFAAEGRLFNTGEHIIREWQKLSTTIINETTRVRFKNLKKEMPLKLIDTSFFIISTIVLFFGVVNNEITAGMFVANIYLVQQFQGNMASISRLFSGIQTLVNDLLYVKEFLDGENIETEDGEDCPEIQSIGLRFDNVCFYYPGSDRETLKTINLHIKPGEKIAIVGENGAGKSTLVKLLLGLYRPSTGKIFIEGTPLEQINIFSWRKKTAAVMQDFMRYPFSIQENIGLGDIEQIEDAETIVKAAKLSTAHYFINELPNKYETLLGKEFEDGLELSLGQWQKLAIARAYIRDADLLVLDEPASALDALAEQEIYRQFVNLSVNKTVILISHRLGSAKLADRIIYLYKGEIAEEGTHEQLMKLGGKYAEIYDSQAEWYRNNLNTTGVN